MGSLLLHTLQHGGEVRGGRRCLPGRVGRLARDDQGGSGLLLRKDLQPYQGALCHRVCRLVKVRGLFGSHGEAGLVAQNGGGEKQPGRHLKTERVTKSRRHPSSSHGGEETTSEEPASAKLWSEQEISAFIESHRGKELKVGGSVHGGQAKDLARRRAGCGASLLHITLSRFLLNQLSSLLSTSP